MLDRLSIESLEKRYQAQRKEQSDSFNLRIYRTISWLKGAEAATSLDHKFINLWIAFNAAYAREFEDGLTRDHISVNEFLGRICALDEHHSVYDLIWTKFSGSIRLLLDNQFVFQPFWDFQNGKIAEKEWLRAFYTNRDQAYYALETKNTHRILSVVFNSLYTLRNQIMHGGATFESGKNREQLRDGCNILAFLLPAMLDVMLSHHNEIDWGKPYYPVIRD